MLVVISAASFILVSKLNSSTRQYIRLGTNLSAMAEAKAALIGYALTYPETHPGDAPGYLPCPDRNNDGSTDVGACSLAGGTTIGRLPYRTLNLDRLTDQAGEPLWYMLANNYRNNPKIAKMNSDVTGNLNVNSITDIVAVIFAPGVPVASQNRIAAGINNVVNYLEDDNADNDVNFVSRAAGEFNDSLVYITRQELMTAVEKRVLGDVSGALMSYHDDVLAFPWLASFNPTATDYDPTTNKREGQLGYNAVNEVFRTDFTVDWTITQASSDGSPVTLTATAAVPSWYDVNSLTVNLESPVYGAADGIAGPACTWVHKEAISCTGRAKDPQAMYTLPVTILGLGGGNINISAERFYDFKIIIPSDGDVTVTANGPVAYLRQRDLLFNPDTAAYPATGFPPGTSISMTATYDSVTGIVSVVILGFTVNLNINDGAFVSANICVPPFGCFAIPLVNLSFGQPLVVSNTVTRSTNTSNNVDVDDIAYDLGVDDEIPSWVVNNDWHKFVYAAYSAGDVPAAASACNPISAPTCLKVELGINSVQDTVQAVVMTAGRQLSGLAQDRVTPPVLISDYFEEENSGVTADRFEKQSITQTFNDQIRILLP